MKKDSTFASISVTVDIVLFTIEDNALKVLLIKRQGEPFKNSSALPGGFIHKNETSTETAKRILKAKAGIENVYIEQLYTFDSPARDPRGQIFSVTYFALAAREKIKIDNSPTNQQPHFVSINHLPKLAFDHSEIIEYALKRLRSKVEYTNIVYSLLPSYFPLAHLQKMYEIILGKKFDKRNFQKKYLSLTMLKLTDKVFKGGRQRPARLYEFKTKKPDELKKFI